MRRPSVSPSLRRALAVATIASAATLATTATIATAPDARADDLLVPRPPRIVPPGRSLAGTDDSDAIALNPAQIAFMRSWELRYTHVQLSSDATTLTPGRGDAIGFATPLFFGFATGMRFDFVRPPASAPLPRLSAWSWTLAWKLADSLSIAVNTRRWSSDDLDAIDGATALDLALSIRPSRYWGLAFVARDLNAARGHIPPSISPDARITRSFDFGLALRPLATRTLEIGLESTVYARSLGTEPAWSPRVTLGVDIPRFGRAIAAMQIADPTNSSTAGESWTVTAGVDIGFGSSRLGGGAIVGKGLGGKPGWYATASVAGYEEPGIQLPDRAVSIRVEETPGARGHVHLLRKLARLGRDPTVRAVVLIVKADLASSTAHAEELAASFTSLQQHGIKVLCHLEDGGAKALFACAGADRILINPAGGVRFAGFRTQSMYFGEALDKLGVVPDFIRIKEHKSAPEELVRSGPTPVAEADQKEFLDTIEGIYIDRFAAARRLTPAVVRANIAKGPFVADEAIEAGFVDAKAFDDEIGKHVHEVVGDYVRMEEDEAPTLADKSFGTQPRLAIIYIDGDIVDGRSQNIPLLGERLAGSYTIADAIKEARESPDIKGVVLRIESPGGSSLASDVMWREAELLGKSKPTIVSMGSIAASGGYYAAAFGAPIYAERATLTGSIGIFYGKADISGLLTKLGVHVVTQKTAPHADAESLFRPFTEEEHVELGKKVEQFYSVFLDRVSRGRHMSVEAVDEVGRGKVWLGDAAKAHHLVDVIGGIDEAIAALRTQLDLAVDSPIEELPVEKNGLFDLVLGLLGGAKVDVADALALPKLLGAYARAVAPFVVFAPDEPLAMWEGMEAP